MNNMAGALASQISIPRDVTLQVEITQDERTFLHQFNSSLEGLIAPSTREKLAQLVILVGGCGSVGGNMAMMSIREGAMNLIVADPDNVEIKNLNRQPFTREQVAINKAEALRCNIAQINPYARVLVKPEGLTQKNIMDLVHGSDIVLDGVDIEALDIMYKLHYYASMCRKPVIVGYDLAQTGMIVTYRYDEQKMKPLNGGIKLETIDLYKKVRDAYQQGRITKARFLDFIYHSFVGPVNPLHIPSEFFEELISRDSEDTKTYQLPRTSSLVATMTIQQIINILEKRRTKFVSKIDLADVTSEGRPGFVTRVRLMLSALNTVKQRGERVKGTLAELNLIEQ